MTTMTLDRVKAVKNPLSYTEMKWLKVWTLAHVVLIVLVYQLDSMSHTTFDHTIQAWDANIFQNIAQHGYFHTASIAHNQAFFPGYPLILAVVHAIAGNWVVSELLIAYVFGSIALVGIARLHPAAPRLFLMSPAAIFLMVGTLVTVA